MNVRFGVSRRSSLQSGEFTLLAHTTIRQNRKSYPRPQNHAYTTPTSPQKARLQTSDWWAVGAVSAAARGVGCMGVASCRPKHLRPPCHCKGSYKTRADHVRFVLVPEHRCRATYTGMGSATPGQDVIRQKTRLRGMTCVSPNKSRIEIYVIPCRSILPPDGARLRAFLPGCMTPRQDKPPAPC